MQEILRAPELSATSRIVRIWIMRVSPRLTFAALDDRASTDRHRLRRLSGRRLDDATVSPPSRFGLVVGHEPRRLALTACGTRRGAPAAHRDHHRLVHLVADDATDVSALAAIARFLLSPRRALAGVGLLPQHRLDPRQIPAQVPDLQGPVQLSHRLAEAQREQLPCRSPSRAAPARSTPRSLNSATLAITPAPAALRTASRTSSGSAAWPRPAPSRAWPSPRPHPPSRRGCGRA